MKIDTLHLNDIIPSDYNPRLISRIEQNKLKKNLKQFGLVDPIIINLHNNHIIGGHQRYNVLYEKYISKDKNPELTLLRLGDIGWAFFDKDLKIETETEEKALNLALNKISGEWDYNKLNYIIDDVLSDNLDIELTGFDDTDLLTLDLHDDDIPNFAQEFEFIENVTNNENEDKDENNDNITDQEGTMINGKHITECPYCHKEFEL